MAKFWYKFIARLLFNILLIIISPVVINVIKRHNEMSGRFMAGIKAMDEYDKKHQTDTSDETIEKVAIGFH